MIIRHHSPSATAGPKTAPSRTSCEPPIPRTPTPCAISATNTSRVTTTRTPVAIAVAEPARTRRTGAPPRRPPPAHSGQRTPTAAWVMHEVQMGRSQLEHETSVSRSGWR